MKQMYNGMTIAEIAENIGKMCTEGINLSTIIEMRKAFKLLARDMSIESSKYKMPLDKTVIVEIKNR